MTSKKERQEVEFEVVGIQKPHRRSSFMRDYGFPYPMVNNSELTSEERDKLDLLRLGKTSVLKVSSFSFYFKQIEMPMVAIDIAVATTALVDLYGRDCSQQKSFLFACSAAKISMLSTTESD